MSNGNQQQKLAVDSGALVLFRYNPDLAKEGKNPLTIDSKEPSIDIAEYMYNENRFRALKDSFPERAKTFLEQARKEAKRRYQMYKNFAEMEV
jgi:pyruvate-ferredoxin/flavodoxin oxidoreductase